jgi:hypothetical protein
MADTSKDGGLKEVEDIESTETYAKIMATHKPNPLGPGYIKLYLLSAVVFLCSTMNGVFNLCLIEEALWGKPDNSQALTAH